MWLCGVAYFFAFMVTVKAKLFFPNESEFTDGAEDHGYEAVNISKWKISRQNRLMQQYMKANTHSLTIKLITKHQEYLHISGTQITMICYGNDEIYDSITENNSKVHVNWWRDVLDLEETDANFRLNIYKDRTVLQPAIQNDTGYYACVINNEVVGSASIRVENLSVSLADGLVCMLILSASGFLPFVGAIVIHYLFAGQRRTLAEIERQKFLKRQQERMAKYERIEYEEDEDEQWQKMADDYYDVYATGQKK